MQIKQYDSYYIRSFTTLTFAPTGIKPGILSSIFAVAIFDFFFVPPLHNFNVADVRFIPTFIVLLSVGIITSFLVAKVKEQMEYISVKY